VVPGKGGEKGYVLLREAMKQTKKVGIAKVVIRTRQYLSALKPEGDALLLNLLRFNQEIVPMDEFDIPGKNLKTYHISQKEVDLAKQLIDGMTEKWKPESYQDEYRDALMKLIEKKISTGKTEEITEGEEAPEPQSTKTINFMDVLKKSLDQKPAKKPAPRKTRGSTKKRRVG
jgi:DNA end-binding protein Ku